MHGRLAGGKSFFAIWEMLAGAFAMQYSRAMLLSGLRKPLPRLTYDDIIAFMIWNNGEKQMCRAAAPRLSCVIRDEHMGPGVGVGGGRPATGHPRVPHVRRGGSGGIRPASPCMVAAEWAWPDATGQAHTRVPFGRHSRVC